MMAHLRSGREAPRATISWRFSLESSLGMVRDLFGKSGARGPTAAEGFVELDVGDGAVCPGVEQAFLEAEEGALGIEDDEEIDLAGLVAEAGEGVCLAGGGGGFLKGGEAFRTAATGDERVLRF